MRGASLGLFAVLGVTVVLLARPADREKGPAPGAKAPKVVLVIHGGAGVLNEQEMKDEKLKQEQFEEALAAALSAGYKALQKKDATSAEGVEAAIRSMEDNEQGLFNAGRGAALDNDGRASLDAAIMEGRMTIQKGEEGEGKEDPRKRAGAVAAVNHIKNPISAARAVMEMKGQQHVLLIGEGAEWFALGEENKKRFKIEKVSNVHFWSDRRLRQIRKDVAAGRKKEQTRQGGGADRRFGTVGAVARKNCTLAAGTSTGGLTNKLRGRVGDSPLIGAGTYADDRACAVSCTGTGEVFIRHAVAHDVIARMLYKPNCSVNAAVDEAIAQLPDEKDGGVGGLIALDNKGQYAFGMSKLSVGMYRGYVTEKGEIFVAVVRENAFKWMNKPGKERKGSNDKP